MSVASERPAPEPRNTGEKPGSEDLAASPTLKSPCCCNPSSSSQAVEAVDAIEAIEAIEAPEDDKQVEASS